MSHKEKQRNKNDLINLNDEVDENGEIQNDKIYKKTVSFLTPDAVPWMNKRRPNASHLLNEHIPPARALQLLQIYRSLDFDGSGEISLSELKEAIAYVAANRKSDSIEPPLFENPAKVSEFFDAMDTDGNGTVDYNEFLLAMTSQAGSTDVNKLQQAFFDFANQHRRQRIVDIIEDKNVPDMKRLEQTKSLFSINFFRDEGDGIHTVEEQIKKAIKDANREKKEMLADCWKDRQTELLRARHAYIYFKQTKASQNEKNIKNTKSFTSLITSDIIDENDKNYKIDKINKKLANKLKKNPISTIVSFTPKIDTNKSKLSKLYANIDSQLSKYEGMEKAKILQKLKRPPSFKDLIKGNNA